MLSAIYLILVFKVVNSVSSCQSGLERCCPTVGYTCGIRYPSVAGARTVVAGSGEALFLGENSFLNLFCFIYFETNQVNR